MRGDSMGYTVTFYAMNGTAVAEDMRRAQPELVARIEKLIHQQSDASNNEVRVVMDAFVQLCRGDVPPDCGIEFFSAFCWLAEVTAERVTICPFQDFRHLSYLDEIGIWPWLLRHPPPFPVPRCSDETPQIGFLSLQDIEHFALQEFSRLPPTQDRDVLNARDEFRDVLETLIPDQLDLLAVLL